MPRPLPWGGGEGRPPRRPTGGAPGAGALHCVWYVWCEGCHVICINTPDAQTQKHARTHARTGATTVTLPEGQAGDERREGEGAVDAAGGRDEGGGVGRAAAAAGRGRVEEGHGLVGLAGWLGGWGCLCGCGCVGGGGSCLGFGSCACEPSRRGDKARREESPRMLDRLIARLPLSGVRGCGRSTPHHITQFAPPLLAGFA